MNAFGPTNSVAASPDAATVEKMLPDKPVVILRDELVLDMARLTQQEEAMWSALPTVSP